MENTQLNNDQTFWIKICTILGIISIFLTLSITSCTAYKYHKIDTMTKNGISPIEVRCALGTEDHRLCAMFFVKQAAKDCK